MIGYLSGRVLQVSTNICLLEVNGVGYEVEMPSPSCDSLQKDSQLVLFTHLVVREDAQLLFGFITQGERDLFRELIKASGVGPKLGILLMSYISPDEFIRCIAEKNSHALCQVKGVGPKMAERLIVEFSNRLNHLQSLGISMPVSQGEQTNTAVNSGVEDVVEALLKLGYSRKLAYKAVNDSQATCDNTPDLLRHALRRIQALESGELVR